MERATYINEIKFENITLEKKNVTKKFLAPMAANHLYKLEKLSFHRVKSDNIFTVEQLV